MLGIHELQFVKTSIFCESSKKSNLKGPVVLVLCAINSGGEKILHYQTPKSTFQDEK